MSDFEHLGEAYKDLSMQVIEESIDKKYGIIESYAT